MVVALWCVLAHTTATAQIDSVTGEVRQPRTINELVDAFTYTFGNILTKAEYAMFKTGTPDEVRAQALETYEKISQNVVRWTDDWIAYTERSLETVPGARLAAARATASKVDTMLAAEFAERGLVYRPLEVVFLPQRLFHDERDRYSAIGGMFIPFYPGKFFATINPEWPQALVLVHESIHFNKTGASIGRRLAEGVTQVGTEAILRKRGWMSAGELRALGIYEDECAGVDAIIDAIVGRSAIERDAAFDMLFRTYLTGEQQELRELFGEDAWKRLVELSTSGTWSRKAILKALR